MEGDIPVPGDYDGDGITDIAVWRPSAGTWFILLSSTGATQTQGWGVSGDIPVVGDFDGDGKTDFAVWRPSNNTWFILLSSTGATQIQAFGDSDFGDTPVPGDYDGDGKTDIAVWRPSEGNWYILQSSNGSTRIQGWGLDGDTPVPGDYDGDGKTDIAVWRPSDSHWYISLSSTGNAYLPAWGVQGDVPIFPSPLSPMQTAAPTSKPKPFHPNVAAQCPGPSSPQKSWIWSPVTYTEESALSAAAISNAAQSWNDQSNINLQPPGPDGEVDVMIADDNSLPSDEVGLTTRYDQSYGTCLNMTDSCGHCMTTGILYAADTVFNANQIIADASAIQVDLFTLTEAVAAHEFGHVLGLTEVKPVWYVCSEVASIMYQDAGVVAKCNDEFPSSECDIPAVLSNYPAPIAPWCQCSGQPCQ